MTTYRDINDTEVAVDAPLTQQLMQALRDNQLAILEGDGTAPDITHVSLPTAQGGTVRLFRSLEVSGATSDTFGYNYTMLRAGTFRFRFEYSKASGSGSMDIRLLKNGVEVVDTGTIGSTTSDTEEHDVTFAFGDTWKVKLNEINNGISGASVTVSIGCDALAASTIGQIAVRSLDGS